MTVLDTILAHKRGEVEARRAAVSLADVQARARDASPARDFMAALGRPPAPNTGGARLILAPPVLGAGGAISLIAEVKKASPSAGIIRANFNPAQIAREYEAAGTAGLSVLTDEQFFQGHDRYLQEARQAVGLPILRKDFVIDEWQVYESRELGADAILLIVAALAPSQVKEWGALAQSLGMAALVEVHTEAEMEVAVGSGATLIGINSRDLKTFHTDLAVVERLAPMAPPRTLLVAESGLRLPADVARVRAAGARAVLVGETFMRAPDIGASVRELMAVPEVCSPRL